MMEQITTDIDKILNRKSSFKHIPIDAKSQVRLLKAHPPATSNSGSRFVRYTLEAFNIIDLPSTTYHSLSYTWGNAHDLIDLGVINVDRQPFFVRRNLHDFLHAAAARGQYGLYFVDAVCIDQRDYQERQDQVARMPTVYRHADTVISWLGEPNAAHAGDVRALALGLRRGRETADWTAAQWQGLQYLSHHSYWSRVWVVQEVLLAKNIILWCGGFSFPLSIFTNSPTSATNHCRELKTDQTGRPSLAPSNSERCQSPAERILSHRTRYVLVPRPDPLGQGTTVGTLAEMSHALQRPVSKLVAYQSSFTNPLHEVIRTFGQLECSDPRDKLYGFLGILNEQARGLVNLDYTKDVTFAYYQALKIGLEEIYGREGSIMEVEPPSMSSSKAVHLPYLSFYCHTRDAFGIGDAESMYILKQVLRELRFGLRARQDVLDAQIQLQFGWRSSEVRLHPELKKILRACESEEPRIKNRLFRFHQRQQHFLQKLLSF
ncbi:heterokaryon incompatibility protein-domain-containing protein [Xylariaceae sp. FL0255]|nr:heterokaryon incompatibility protein-domain-containing protein [Xylariaceae sp. FL0255]